MNNIVITGRLTRDPELTTVSTGQEKCRFSVAVDRRKNKDGERQTDFFDCAAWGKTGAFISQWFHTGDGITVRGRMESHRTEKDGVKVVYWGINVDEVEFALGKREGSGSGAPATPAADAAAGFAAVETDSLPF